MIRDHFRDFIEEFQRETDRAAAVLAAAYLDSRLEALLRSKFVAVPGFVDELLTGQGGLASFSARISVAYAVGLISLPVASDLHLVRRIRNDFAHELMGLSFNTPAIADRVRELRILQGLQSDRGGPVPLSDDPRIRFNVAVTLLLVHGLETRIRESPQFREPVSEAIRLELFREQRRPGG